MKLRKAYDILADWQQLAYHDDDGTDPAAHELYQALQVALPFVRAGIKCDRCGKAKAVELSDTGLSYCRRCWRAATDGRSPY